MKVERRRMFFISIMILLSCSLFAPASYAKNIDSAFGFSMQVQDDWLVLSKKSVSDSALMTQKLEKYGFSESGIEDIIKRVSWGSSEMLYIPVGDDQFSENDNVNYIKSFGVIPDKETLPGLCEATQEQISHAFQKETKMDKCEYRKHGQLTSVYLEFDGLIDGTRNAQYHVHGEGDLYLVFSLTSTKAYFNKSNLALDVLINSIVIK